MAGCISPYNVKHRTKPETIPVPCGKCYNCKQRRGSQWSFRLMQHEKVSCSSQFITLTYDTTHVPITSAGYMGLRFSDVQLFFKRLRKAHTSAAYRKKGLDMGSAKYRLKYFCVGEYGDTYKRPHYHIILFNSDVQLIQSAWNKGEIHYGEVSGASVGYTLKYITKEGWRPMHKNDDREKPRYQMSKGLGLNYLTPAIIKFHKTTADNMYCTTEQGQKIAMPRYYKDKIWPEQIIDEEYGIKIPNYQRKVFAEQNFKKYLRKLLEYEKTQNYERRRIARDQQNIRNLSLNKTIDKL